MNNCIFKGRLTSTPELQATPDAIEYCNFSIAVDRYAGKGKEKTADFVTCKAWRQTAAFISQYFEKGQEILVQGEMHFDKYDKDGETRTYTYLNVIKAEFCGSKRESVGMTNNTNSSSGPQNANLEGFKPVSNEDLPF